MSSIDPNVSDLFFNYAHDGYHQVYTDTKPDDNVNFSKIHRSIFEDAKEFCDIVERAFGVKIDPIDLSKDFFNRV